MATPLLNSPAEIVQALLIALSQGSVPPVGSVATDSEWPIYATNEPNAPDNCITIYDTTNQHDGRSMVDGRNWTHYGFQVRVRAVDHPTGYVKAKAIEEALLTQVGIPGIGGVRVTCLNGNIDYVVKACVKVHNPINLGKDTPRSKRSLFTINGLLVL